MTRDEPDVGELLRKPIGNTTQGDRLVNLLGGSEAIAYATMSLGDIIYDRVSIDPNALDAFHFIKKPTAHDIYRLAVWSDGIEHKTGASYLGDINSLKGSVFERVAAASIRQSGAHVVFPNGPNQPGWDFLVNGEPVQAKCGVDAGLVTKHLHRYPNIQRVVVSENLGAHFLGHDHIMSIPGASDTVIRASTEQSLHAAADMLDAHLLQFIPTVLVARNAFAWLRGQTDMGAIAQNLIVEAPSRWMGAYAGHAVGGVAAMILGGWPAILVPVATSMAGYRTARAASDAIKRKWLLREEYAQVMNAISEWCRGVVGVLDRAIAGAERDEGRFLSARQAFGAVHATMADDWLLRLTREQAGRRYHRNIFERAIDHPHVFGAELDAVSLAGASMLAAARAGIVSFDLVPERNGMIKACDTYVNGLKRRLIRR